MTPIRKLLCAFAFVATLAGCSSGVKLNDVPVVDQTASSSAGSTGTGAAGATTAQSNVATVTPRDSGTTAAGPSGVARIVYFDYDSYVVKPDFQSLLDAHSRFLKAGAQRRIAVEGHTDERGGSEYNLALGQRRAEAVRRALTLLGVADNQIEAVSFGKEKPAVSGSDESAYAQNRRAEITYR